MRLYAFVINVRDESYVHSTTHPVRTVVAAGDTHDAAKATLKLRWFEYVERFFMLEATEVQ